MRHGHRQRLRESLAIRSTRRPRALPAVARDGPRAMPERRRRSRLCSDGERDVSATHGDGGRRWTAGRSSLRAIPARTLQGRGDRRPEAVRRLFGRMSRISARKTRSNSRLCAAWLRTLMFPCSIAGVPTVREPDGLALSSRNLRLSADERQLAPCLYAALQARRGERRKGRVERVRDHPRCGDGDSGRRAPATRVPGAGRSRRFSAGDASHRRRSSPLVRCG